MLRPVKNTSTRTVRGFEHTAVVTAAASGSTRSPTHEHDETRTAAAAAALLLQHRRVLLSCAYICAFEIEVKCSVLRSTIGNFTFFLASALTH